MMKKTTLLALVASVFFAGQADAQMKLLSTTHSIFRSANTYTDDSVVYWHSGTKGTGAPKFDIPEFELMEDSAYIYEYNTTSKMMELSGKVISTYNASSNTDTKTTQTWTSGAWKNSSRARVTYVSNKPDTVFYETWSTFGSSSSWRLSSAMVYSWSGNNMASAIRLTRTMGGGGNPPGWRNDWRTTYSWNGANKMTDSVHSDWVSNAWENIEKRTIAYDASNKRATMNRDGWVSGAWSPFYKTTYTYDGTARMITRTEQQYSSGNWIANNRDTIMYNTGNTTSTPDTIIKLVATVGPLANTEKWGFEYLSNGLPTKRTTFSWDGVSKWKQLNDYDSVDTWNWGFNVGINDVEQHASVMEVYPNPATDVLHVTLKGMDDKQVNFNIVNVEGRTLRNWQTSVTNAGVRVSVADYPSGVYFLQMNDGKQTVTQRFVIQR